MQIQLRMKPRNTRPVVLSKLLSGPRYVKTASHYRVIEKSNADKNMEEVNDSVTGVKNRVQDKLLTAMDGVGMWGV